MAVMLADLMLSVVVHAHPFKRDPRGVPIPDGPADTTTRGPFPGAALEQQDNSWTLWLDPACWPVRAGDTITDGTRTWVAGSNPDPKLNVVPGYSDVDHIKVIASLDPPKVP